MTTYRKPMPNTVQQNNLKSIEPYNPKDPPKILFKLCTNCKEIAIIARVPCMTKNMFIDVVDLRT
jgi:hypothetical protein